ncbi:UDP-N-acetylglucosamine 1-carboxyvinyltransferase [Aerococcus christensenii]|uniref:UDP-N-acetylglucosamine 1-carboxyvinyltransferase n=1 Tax=Aerococcus christensenii TaxID=87541 RepID=A0A120I8T2_9LACT|nr:UDP-N-acetylglucosamine 1-carboxyvinyltransferase [Aerococcus christensenii]AMB92768.1 UDP-N-acetylglucosamine 1-carboxyvinyltransferase [Aerococcus christensenii]KXB38042.1 UDP-N-acetylglucosamine 1-carboxyvinyltransferase [Aerococcus christensenii]MDK8234467.1 UDP-N-acetylglucosamine 1-carboxyvinyltransferase [Aerococcus christensenii]WEB71374.1 UDP-N-acetylglucosamine 1-carboxyvinyltransferase [Aerococcus christensenii]
MENMVIRGGKRLVGTVQMDGAKNTVLPILAATLLASEGQSVVKNAPLFSDVYLMNHVLSYLQAEVSFDEDNHQIFVDASKELTSEAPFEFVSKMRASVVVMGPLLARLGYVKVAMPGGCAIGTRPIDLHIKGFEALGVTVTVGKGEIEASCPEGLKGAEIYLDFPSVGATENIMMAATLAEGVTLMENVAKEPEIVDLANFLNRMGAKITGAGTDMIRIRGVKSLKGVAHTVIPDRIEAGTFMVAAAITHGDITIQNAVAEHNLPLISKLREMGVEIIEGEEQIRVIGPERLKGTNIKTLPYPGFPTDLQAPFSVAQTVAEGQSKLEETVFENRFMHLEEMRRMTLDYQLAGDTAKINGPNHLKGAYVKATDLRAAAALILAGLVAEGITRVGKLEYLDRGYASFDEKLRQLGADIVRVTFDEKEKVDWNHLFS